LVALKGCIINVGVHFKLTPTFLFKNNALKHHILYNIVDQNPLKGVMLSAK